VERTNTLKFKLTRAGNWRMTMWFLWFLASATGCDSLAPCAVQCDKNDAAACLWMARHLPSVERAARACNLDSTHCEWLSMEQLSFAKTPAEREAATAAVQAACAQGEPAACERLISFFRASISYRAPLPAPADAAAQTLCAKSNATTWFPSSSIVNTCAMTAHFDVAFARAKQAAKTPQEAASLAASLMIAVDTAATAKEKARRIAELSAMVVRGLPACAVATDEACAELSGTLRFLPTPTAVTVAAKLCTVLGSEMCDVRDEAACDNGNGEMAACVRIATHRGFVETDVQKKLAEGCLKNDASACFASGVALASMGAYGGMLSSTDAFARGCALKDARSCRATTKIAPIARPVLDKQAIDIGNKEKAWIKIAGSGATLGTHVLVARTTFYGEEGQSVTQVLALDQTPALGGLKEGADVVVFGAHGEITRYVAVVNVER
jgi:hypothetical protein